MIKRDKFGYIGQHNPLDVTYLDFGDCAGRTGLSVVFNIDQSRDSILLRNFEILKENKEIPKIMIPTGLICRHPVQPPWNNYKNMTRDNLVLYVTGCWRAGRTDIVRRVFWSRAKSIFFCQNTERDIPGSGWKFPDVLLPDVIWHLMLCGEMWYLYWFALAGIPFLLISILWSSKIKPLAEQNQIICQCLVAGNWSIKLYKKLHKSWEAVLDKYWGVSDSEWRYQPEFSIAIKETIRSI